MGHQNVTPADMDDLLAFLPIFTDKDAVFVLEWNRYPQYSADVFAFYHLAGRPCWTDYNYLESEAVKHVDDDAFIAGASLDDIKALLTLFVRSERFGDGNWAYWLKSGRVVAVLQRFAVLRAEWRGSE